MDQFTIPVICSVCKKQSSIFDWPEDLSQVPPNYNGPTLVVPQCCPFCGTHNSYVYMNLEDDLRYAL